MANVFYKVASSSSLHDRGSHTITGPPRSLRQLAGCRKAHDRAGEGRTILRPRRARLHLSPAKRTGGHPFTATALRQEWLTRWRRSGTKFPKKSLKRRVTRILKNSLKPIGNFYS